MNADEIKVLWDEFVDSIINSISGLYKITNREKFETALAFTVLKLKDVTEPILDDGIYRQIWNTIRKRDSDIDWGLEWIS